MNVPDEVIQTHDKTKYALLQDKKSVFIANILFSLQVKWTDELPTLATDGVNLMINPDFYMGLSKQLRVSALAHETWHVAFKHMLRVGLKDPDVWNEACDHFINLMLKKAGYTIDPNWCCDDKYQDMACLDIYNLLHAEKQKNGNTGSSSGMGLGSGKSDISQPTTPNGNKMDESGLEAKINSTLMKAAAAAKMTGQPGLIPGSIEQELDMITNPPLSWEVIFQNILSSYSKDDFTYKRVNRRFLPDYILPSLYNESYGEVIFGFDTSGSMTDDQVASFIGHLNYVQTYIKPEKITIWTFDTKVRTEKSFERGEDMASLKFEGRGGTDMQDLFNKADKLQPRLLVVYSDLDCTPITDERPYPVVWLCADNPRKKVSFGTLIHVDSRGN
jgi:predicted metal-dependent peptidase